MAPQPSPLKQTPTALLSSLPTSSLVGIDLITFTSSPKFTGIKDLPPGIHFLLAGASASLSARCGFWFRVPESTAERNEFSSVWPWDVESEELVPESDSKIIEKWRERLERKDVKEGLVGYEMLLSASASASTSASAPRSTPTAKATAAITPMARVEEVDEGDEGAAQTIPTTTLAAEVVAEAEAEDAAAAERRREDEKIKATDWPLLTSHITDSLLSRFCYAESDDIKEGHDWAISTTSTGKMDREEIPGLEPGKWERERQLGFVEIDLKRTWREGAVGEERTRGARDRSWALESVVESLGEGEESEKGKKGIWGKELLGEMQVCFLMVLLLANYSCLEQWKRILSLVLTCREALKSRTGFFAEFVKVLQLQLRHCSDVEGGLFEVADNGGNYLKGLLRGFRRAVGEICSEDSGLSKEVEGLEAYLREQWGWEIGDSFVRRGMVQLEDGENVELEVDEMEDEDERGEYAPVVVGEGELA